MSSPEKAPSLQRRLTLGLTVALGVILALMSAGLDYLVDSELHAYMNEKLMRRAHSIAAVVEAQSGDLDMLLYRLMPEYRLPNHTDFFEIWDDAGASFFRSETSGIGQGLTRPPAWPATGPLYYDLRLPDGDQGRALALPLDVSINGRAARFTLVVASERILEDRLETGIDYALIAGVALALVLTLSIARWTVRRGLAPVLRAGERIARSHGDLPPAGALHDPALPRELRPFTQALDAAFARLRAAIERERSFSLNAAHELRTPLAEIRTVTEVAARMSGDTQAVQAAFADTLGAVERMQRAIDTLLLLARYEAGHASPALDPLDLPALLDTLLDAFAPLAAQRGIVFERAYAAGQWVRSDMGALERIASNLLNNAIAYAPQGSRVGVGVQAGEGEGGSVALVISNLAPDLTAGDLANLGMRFWRKSAGGGTAANAGLGLALVQGLARSMGLQIDFELAQGRLSARVTGLTRL